MTRRLVLVLFTLSVLFGTACHLVSAVTRSGRRDPVPAPDSLVATVHADTLADLELILFPPAGIVKPYSYQVVWGDGDTLDWTVPLPFNYDVSRHHRYQTHDTFDIRVRVRDSSLAVSDWSDPLPVIITDPPLKWVFPTFDPVVASATLDEHGYTYIGDDSGWLYSIDSAGTLRWGFETNEAIFGAVTLNGNRIYFGSLDSNLYCVDRETGELVWKLAVADELYTPPALDNSGNVYVGTDAGFLVVVSPEGEELWRFDTGDEITGSPSIGPDGNVYITSDSLYCLGPDGQRRWAFGTASESYFFASPVPGPDDNVYVGDVDGYLYAIGPDGSMTWRAKVPDEDEIRSEAVFDADGGIWVGTDGYYLCHKAPGDTFTVAYEADDIVTGTAAVSDRGTVYFLPDDGYVYARRADGRILWKYEIAADEKDTYYTSSPVIGPDGTVYIGSWDGGLFALRGDGPPAQSPWPQYRHDARHTGRSTR
jgi:outer membrane protein assembly factor BamB